VKAPLDVRALIGLVQPMEIRRTKFDRLVVGEGASADIRKIANERLSENGVERFPLNHHSAIKNLIAETVNFGMVVKDFTCIIDFNYFHNDLQP